MCVWEDFQASSYLIGLFIVNQMNEGVWGVKGGCQVSKGNLAQRNEVCCHNRSSRGCRLETESKMLEKFQKALTIRSSTVRELLAEALGMFILMVRRRRAQACVSVCVHVQVRG